MSVSSAMTDLMNASRRIYGDTGKLSVSDLTKLLSNRYTSELIDIFNYSDFQKWNIPANLKVTLNENDGSATITQSNVQITHNERLYSPDLPISIDEHMTAIIVAKISADCSENSVALSVGAYDAGAWVMINSKNYKVYTVPLMSSATTHFSMYVNPVTQSIVGDLIDIKSLIIMDSHFLRDSTS